MSIYALTMTYSWQVNFSSGRYFTGTDKGLDSQLPFDAGFEVQDYNMYCDILQCFVQLAVSMFVKSLITITHS